MKYQGRLINWNDSKGYGFVEPNGGGDRAFVHIKSFQKYSRRPCNGDLIVYRQVQESQNKFKASNIQLVIDRKVKPKSSTSPSVLGVFFTITFCIILITAVYLQLLPLEISYLYATVSFITFLTYAFDKSAARNNRRRVPESRLHFLSLLGGWPGAYLAQRKLRHKSVKIAFKQVFWVTVAVNLSAFIWLFTQQGKQFINTVFIRFN
ncbi:cold shock and DUF1294 domain-containing protein [Alteromonas sp. 1_MG-2023]|uniref:cold shock and DUF1294 domain-containing protein n=1 Tax=Alteromonas sp. 1_MG-2023 TaxID=3062669 RepID=UPI0026E1670C|nr:cold shock and DUF1294 domain-containing protein [Alteromonas sp. 1_MG-2023]MDO6568842.1 cold shock and DUF1294 domain-containing protein [Alteromonas sp. 1_MG-2023]